MLLPLLLGSFNSCLLLLVALPGLIDILCAVASLKVPTVIVYDVIISELYFIIYFLSIPLLN